jgi:hypothetical protein
MSVRFRIIVGDENAEQEESLLVSLISRACRRSDSLMSGASATVRSGKANID